MRTVEIPGGSAVLRDPDELRTRDADLIEAYALSALPAIRKLTDAEELTAEALATAMEKGVELTPEEWSALIRLRRAALIACLESWTLPEPLPTMATIGDVPRAVIVALDTALGGVPAPTDFSVSSDPDSPTSGSSDSGRPSTDSPLPLPTPKSSDDGESTATASSIPA